MQQFYKIFTARFAFYMVLQFFLCFRDRAEVWGVGDAFSGREGPGSYGGGGGGRFLPHGCACGCVSGVVLAEPLRPGRPFPEPRLLP